MEKSNPRTQNAEPTLVVIIVFNPHEWQAIEEQWYGKEKLGEY